MRDRYGISVFPPPMPKTPAGRYEIVADMTRPVQVHDDEGNLVEVLPPILTPEEGLRLMDWPENVDPEIVADFDASMGTHKTRWILYSGEFVEPDVMDNLDREHRSTVWALTKMPDLPLPVRKSLERYVAAIAKLRSAE
jgi:hypothetical protein